MSDFKSSTSQFCCVAVGFGSLFDDVDEYIFNCALRTTQISFCTARTAAQLCRFYASLSRGRKNAPVDKTLNTNRSGE